MLNGKEEACQSTLSKLFDPSKQQCTVDNLGCTEIGIKGLDVSLIRSRLVEHVYRHRE